MTTLLIDGDVLAYQASQLNEIATEVEPGYWTWHCEFHKVIEFINWQLSAYKKRLESKDFVLCLTDYESNFRHQVEETYKDKRKSNKKPLVLKPTREHLITKYDAKIIPTLEGDDVMGILSNKDTIIVSIDKDMKTIPGKYYNPNTDIVMDISKEEADYWHLYQTLVGDPIDGYSGCPNVGAVTAKRMLDIRPTWETVVNAYAAKGLGEDYALVQARLARILRPSDWDGEKPILWTPDV